MIFLGLMISDIQKLKQCVDIPKMIAIIRNLNVKLMNCRDGFEKLAFIEVADLIELNSTHNTYQI